ncbi:MAG TPA: hypothetical protein ENG22_03090 [Candidatus Bathyarchaeota archaeon]|nr:hypothetical protein [Candidatus Bathyarchaeota archaeon]
MLLLLLIISIYSIEVHAVQLAQISLEVSSSNDDFEQIVTIGFYGNTTRVTMAYELYSSCSWVTSLWLDNLSDEVINELDVLVIDIDDLIEIPINVTAFLNYLWYNEKGVMVLGYYPSYAIPYSNDTHGGSILNTTLTLYTYYSLSFAWYRSECGVTDICVNCGGFTAQDTSSQQLFLNALYWILYDYILSEVHSSHYEWHAYIGGRNCSGSIYYFPIGANMTFESENQLMFFMDPASYIGDSMEDYKAMREILGNITSPDIRARDTGFSAAWLAIWHNRSFSNGGSTTHEYCEEIGLEHQCNNEIDTETYMIDAYISTTTSFYLPIEFYGPPHWHIIFHGMDRYYYSWKVTLCGNDTQNGAYAWSRVYEHGILHMKVIFAWNNTARDYYIPVTFPHILYAETSAEIHPSPPCWEDEIAKIN